MGPISEEHKDAAKVVFHEAEDDAFTLALKAEIKALLDKPLTPASVGAMSKILDATAEILMARNPDFALLGNRRRRGGMNMQYMDGYGGEIIPMAGSSMQETFGARVVREIVAVASSMMAQQRPEATVRAIAEARAAGLNDVAERLEQNLSGLQLPKLGDGAPVVPPEQAEAAE